MTTDATSVAAANWLEARSLRLAGRLRATDPQLQSLGLAREGVLRRAVGLTLEASGCSAPMGSRCRALRAGANGLPGAERASSFRSPRCSRTASLPQACRVNAYA